MLVSARQLICYRIKAGNRYIGSCVDILFDDRHWHVCYLVAANSATKEGHGQLVPIQMIDGLCHTNQIIDLSPAAEDLHLGLMDRPTVSLQSSIDIYRRLGIPSNWINGALLAHVPKPVLVMELPANEAEALAPHNHRRSMVELFGYSFDDSVTPDCSVSDFLIDDASWSIKQIIVEHRQSLFRCEEMAISPQNVSAIEWASSRVAAHRHRMANIAKTSSRFRL
jgi:hypothetical protein